MGGDRLPGKVLLPLAGKPMLQNVVERAQRAKLVDAVVVACPVRDFILKGHFIEWHFKDWFAWDGDENDLIGRYLATAVRFDADLIVRIGADNPCVEPDAIDKSIRTSRMWDRLEGTDRRWLLTSAENPDCDYDGFGGEIYTPLMLEWMNDNLSKSDYREHPHKYWYQTGKYKYCGKIYPPGFRLDVNTIEEYEKLKAIYDHFQRNDFTVDEAIEFLNGKNDMEERPISS